jgi:multidrug efflux system membrane fusion protein
VTRGLAPSDVIVVNGLQHVRPGQTVAPTRVAMRDDSDGLTQVAAGTETNSSRGEAGARLAQAAVAPRSAH